MKKWIFTLLLLWVSLAKSQVSPIDSLKSKLKTINIPEEKFELYIKLADEYRRKRNFNDARIYADSSLNMYINTSEIDQIAKSYLTKGNIEYSAWNSSEAFNYYNKVDSILSIKNIKNKTLSKAISNMGHVITSTVEDVNDTVSWKKAIDYYREALEISEKIKDTAFQGYLYVRIGTIENILKKYEDAIQSFKVAEELLEGKSNQTDLYYGFGSAYTDMKDYSNAKIYMELYFKERLKAKSLVDSAYGYWSYGRFNFNIGNYSEAAEYEVKSAELFNKMDSPDFGRLGSVYKIASDSYKMQGNYEDAYKYLDLHKTMNDSALTRAKKNQLNDLEKKYQTEKKEQEIALLEARNKTIEVQKLNQRNLFLAGLGVFSIAGIFFVLVLRNRQKTNRKLKELDSAKSRFFENISHEFRTPLSLINGPIEEQLNKKTLDDHERRNLTIAKNNSSRLVDLVDQILDISKLESNHYRLKVEESNLSQFLKSAVFSFAYQAEIKNQEFDINLTLEEKTYWFDRDVLEKIVNNLLSNAIKYTPEDEKISVLGSVKDGMLRFEVINIGIQLPKEEVFNIFSRFHKAHDNAIGTGIGLALTKELVELHKGSIYAKSDDNWIRFVFNIPIEEKFFSSDEMERDRSIVSESNVSTDRMPDVVVKEKGDNTLLDDSDAPILLIVDDNADIREYLSSLFIESFNIKTAENGKVGFEKAVKYVPDIIITDLMMPNEDGLQLTKNCKTDWATSHIPILMLTAKAGDENILKGIETGADAYITKPFNTDIVRATIHNLLESRKKLQERFSQEVVLTPKELSINSYDEEFLSNLKEVMDTNLVESDFNAENFAASLGMSRMQLHRKLKAITGLSTTEFIRSQRLKLAAQLLKKSEINISQVGYTVGFNNHSYFTKCFKEQFGVSPSDFAKS